MPSFDVISKINYQEFDNALANCLREIGNRSSFTLSLEGILGSQSCSGLGTRSC